MMNQTEFLIAFNSAAGAYQAETGGGSLSPWGYQHLRVWEDAATGAKARAYVDGSGNYIIAFAGTEDLQDAYQDLANYGMAQWNALSPSILSYFRPLADQGVVNSIQFTGHSLGGALAQYAAYDFVSVVDGSAIISASNVSLTTFNALGGELGLKDKFKDKYNSTILNGAKIHHYFDPSDLVSKLSPHLGGQSTNYQLRTSTDPVFTFDAHTMLNMQSYFADGTIRTDLQANHDYFEIDELAPALQLFGEATNGWISGNSSDVSDIEAAARILTMLSVIPELTVYPPAAEQWDALKDFLIDNIVVTTLAPKFGLVSDNSIEGLKRAIDTAVEGIGVKIASRWGGILIGTTLASLFSELYTFFTNGEQLDPAEKALTYSLLNYISGATLSIDENGQFDEKVNESVALEIFQMSHLDDRNAFPKLVKDIGKLLGQNLNENHEDAIGLVNHIVEQGIVLADFMVLPDTYTQERMLDVVNEIPSFSSIPVDPLDARLLRYSIINRLPFILEGAQQSGIDPAILDNERYALAEESDQYWAHRLEFYRQTLRLNEAGHLVIFDKSEHKYFWDAEGGQLLVGKNTFGQGGSNTLQVSEVSNIRFGSDSADPNLYGYDQDDYLYGRAGNDTINAKGGNDYIEGGKGNDTLFGGSGDDTYYYVAGDGDDVISDPEGIDRLCINGNIVRGATKIAGFENKYRDLYGNIYQVEANGDLVITVAKSGDLLNPDTTPSGQIRILNFGDMAFDFAPPDNHFGLFENKGFSSSYFETYMKLINWSEFNDYEAELRNANILKNAIKEKFEESLDPNRYDPLTLDLNGDGIETVSVEQGILFDHNADGVRRGTGWVSADDGLLVMDRNGNGMIDNGGELFGDNTLKTDGSKAINGFDALAELDTNGDDLIDGNDAQFSELRVWQDLNQDGISQSNELHTLDTVGIESIDLAYNEASTDVGNGNIAIAEGVFNKVGGGTGTAASLNLLADSFNREYKDQIEIPESLEYLPELQGSGSVRDLKEAASLNSGLATALEEFFSASSISDQKAMIDTIIAEWAETGTFETFEQRIANTSFDGKPVSFRIYDPSQQDDLSFIRRSVLAITSAEQLLAVESHTLATDDFTQFTNSGNYTQYYSKLKILETFNARAFFDIRFDKNADGLTADFHADVGSNEQWVTVDANADSYIVTNWMLDLFGLQPELIEEAYSALNSSVFVSLFHQSRLQPYVDQLGLLIDATGQISIDFSTVNSMLETLAETDPIASLADHAMLLGSNPEAYTDYCSEAVTSFKTKLDLLDAAQLEAFRTFLDDVPSDWVTYALGDLPAFAPATDSGLNIGSEIADDIRVGRDTSIVMALDGNDEIYGYSEFKKGVVYGGEGNDTLVLATTDESLGSDGVTFYGESGDDIFRGSDADEMAYGGEGLDVLNGYKGNDQLYGGNDNDILNGGEGDDILEGGEGNDTLTGDTGNDILIGGAGEDTYFFRSNEGHDVIYLDSTSLGKIFIADNGIQETNVLVEQVENDLIIKFQTNTGLTFDSSITIKDAFLHENFGLSEIRLSTGKVWTPDQITSLLGVNIEDGDEGNTLNGGANGNDVINGNGGDDFVYGHGGNDTLNGGLGEDRIEGGLGSDTIDGGEGNDTIYGGAWNNPSSGANTILGGNGDDKIEGGSSADIIDGGEGRDQISGGSGNDFLTGGYGRQGTSSHGYDNLRGDTGNDTYIFNLGDGGVIVDQGLSGGFDFDVIRFGEGISPENVDLRHDENSYGYALHINGGTPWTGDYLELHDLVPSSYPNWQAGFLSEQYRANLSPYTIDEIQFADGTVWDTSFIQQNLFTITNRSNYILGSEVDDVIDVLAGNDTLYGFGGNDTLKGGDGNDLIWGGEGSDTLEGGRDNDTIWGGIDNDTYIYNTGDGNDIIYDNAGLNQLIIDGQPITSITQSYLDPNTYLDGMGNTYQISTVDGSLIINVGAGEEQGAVSIPSWHQETNNFGISLLGPNSNSAPSPVSDIATVAEDDTIDIDVLSNDIDIDGDTLFVEAANAQNGAVNINPDGTLTYTPNADFSGTDTITYSVIDGQGGSASSTVSVTVTPVNDDPVVTGEVVSLEEDSVINIDVLGNDTDIEGDTLSVDAAIAQNGAVNINPEGTLTYTPNADFHGDDTIIYEVSDGHGGTATSSVIVTVNPNNDAPLLSSPLLDQTVSEGEVFTFEIPGNSFSDVDTGDILTYSASLADGSSLPEWLNFDAVNLTFSGTPSLSDAGEIDVKVMVIDQAGESSEDIFRLTIENVTDQPLNLTGDGAANIMNGGNADDTINGKGGNDSLSGLGGDDRLIGAGGSDYLYGNEGNDNLKGGAGNDHLFGGSGNDILSGGTGNDTYYFASGDGYDRINNASTNFTNEVDALKLSGIDYQDIWFKQTNLHLDIYLLASSDRVRVNNWYKEDKFQFDRIDLGGSSIDASGIDQLVTAMAGFGAPSGGNIQLSANDEEKIADAIAAAWH